MASKTRIQEEHLQALEEDRFDLLPQKVFVKGFVRSYAGLLHLDEVDCLRLFEQGSASFYQHTDVGQPIALRAGDAPKKKSNRAMVVMLIGVPLLGLLALIQQQSSPPSTSSRVSQPLADERAGESRLRDGDISESERIGRANAPGDDRPHSSIAPPAGVSTGAEAETAREPNRIETPAASAPADRVLASSPAGVDTDRVLLELRALETSWVVVRSDEREPHEVLLQPGDVAHWHADERFVLTLGNAGGVEVRLNGLLRGPFGESGVVARNLELRP